MINKKIIVYRTVLQIIGDIDLEQYNLKNKLIIPLDEYLGIDKLSFKVSIRAIIEIAFWGQNQSSFQKSCEIIYTIYGIKLSRVTVMNITEFIGKIIYDYNYDKALEVWSNRAQLEISNLSKKEILYIQADGASVNTRRDFRKSWFFIKLVELC